MNASRPPHRHALSGRALLAGRAWRRGFTLVELMIVVAIIGVLAALAIYGVTRYMAAAKTSEAKDGVGAISRAAVMAFEEERHPEQLLNEGIVSVVVANILCATADPVPANIISVKGRKYQPSTAPGADFQTGALLTGWRCLNFSKSEAMYYRYTYITDGAYISPGVGGPDPGTGFEAAAQGNVDGDTTVSTFARVGKLEGPNLRLSTQIFVHEEFE